VLTCYTSPGFRHAPRCSLSWPQSSRRTLICQESQCRTVPFVAYRSLDAIIRRSAFGVGGDIQIWVVDSDGQRQLDVTELLALRDRVEIWRSAEIEALEELMAGAPAEAGEPMPEPLND
jgi:hypothetical protein